MDNCFTGATSPAKRQKKPSCISYQQVLGGASYFLFLSRHADVIASFSYSNPIKTPSKLIVGPVGKALPVHWIGY